MTEQRKKRKVKFQPVYDDFDPDLPRYPPVDITEDSPLDIAIPSKPVIAEEAIYSLLPSNQIVTVFSTVLGGYTGRILNFGKSCKCYFHWLHLSYGQLSKLFEC